MSAPHVRPAISTTTADAHSAGVAVPAPTKSDWRVIRSLLPYLWDFRWRVALAVTFLVTAKVANIGVPLLLKEIVDSLDKSKAILVVPFALLAAYGLLRLSSTLFGELRHRIRQGHAARRPQSGTFSISPSTRAVAALSSRPANGWRDTGHRARLPWYFHTNVVHAVLGDPHHSRDHAGDDSAGEKI